MVEKNLIINNRTIVYKGLFKIEELFGLIKETLEKQGYQLQEKEVKEEILPSGKNMFFELRPFKEKTNYVTLMIKIKIALEKIKETKKEINSFPTIFQQGEVILVFDAWLVTDYGARWGLTPWFFFIKTFIHKYVYRFPLEEGFLQELKADVNYLTDQIKTLFNLYRYQTKEEREGEGQKEGKGKFKKEDQRERG